jgi:toxin ParE1/3/4
MAKIVWSPRSIKDVQEIAEFIGKDSIQYAKVQTRLFIEEAAALEIQPYKGRIVPELGISNIRQILCGHYRIIYEVINKEEVGILTVHHQSRLLKNNPTIKKLRRKK